MVQVQQWSGCIKKSGANFNVNLKRIAMLVKAAMGELTGLSGLLNDLDGTLLLTCDSSSTNNHFTKVDMSGCGTKLLGVSFYSNSKSFGCTGLSYYTTELNCKMISADVSQADEDQVAKIKEYFNEKFNIIVTHKKPVVRTPCGPPPKSDPKMKEYKIMSEGVPGLKDPVAEQLSQISLHTVEDGSDEDLCEGEAGCQAPPPSPDKHREEHL
jgi:hypothetical protein